MGAVYALLDPDTAEVRYVGMTGGSPRDRYDAHIEGAHKGGRTRKDSWIRQLEKLGKQPKLSVLEEVDGDRHELADAERRWIRKSKLAAPLTNHTAMPRLKAVS